MKLVIAILNNDDAKTIIPKLMEEGFSATTLNTTGGFLRAGNTTLMIATEEENVEKVRDIFKKYSNARSVEKTIADDDVAQKPEEVKVGGAVMFVMDVKDNFKY